MPHQVKKLSAIFVSKLSSPGYYGDGGARWLQVPGSGSKSWVFRFTIAGNRREVGLADSTQSVSAWRGKRRAMPVAADRRFLSAGVAPTVAPRAKWQDAPGLLGSAAKVGLMESILSLCEARGLASRMLQWHYRSRDPSLITVSNHEFYENGLILPPSPLQEDPAYGLCFTRVDGVYDKGGKRDNRREGEAMVARVAQHARRHPELSLGIVTFSTAQRNLMTELLELGRRSDLVLDEFLREGQAEDVFVKNIENVQGDERDVILISVCYGPEIPGGRLTSMTFGPVNQEGGERRLNVLFTRARVRCEVFASFDPGDIDPGRVSRDGARILKRFLEFARDGRMLDTTVAGEAAESPFEADVADVVRGLGYLVDEQVGSAGFRIDLGIRHPERPGTYIMAIECDGATYHGALWARERDRLRQDVLQHLGWRFHRIWSTDWFYNRSAEVERLRAALQSARTEADAGIRIDGANRVRPSVSKPIEVTTATFEFPASVVKRMPPYERAFFPMNGQEPHDASLSTLVELVKRIVEIEGPIHVEEAARRLAACFGKEKAGARILAMTSAALDAAKAGSKDLLSDEDFWYTYTQFHLPSVRDRSSESGATLKAKSISKLEIKAAFQIAINENAGGAESDLIRAAATLMGFRRVGPDLQERLSAAINVLEPAQVHADVDAMPEGLPSIEGPGRFKIEVAGVLEHQQGIAEVVELRGTSGTTDRLKSHLVLDPDGRVSVRLAGRLIGYLSKYVGRDFRGAVISGGLTEFSAFECWARVQGHDGRFSVWLDLPEDE